MTDNSRYLASHPTEEGSLTENELGEPLRQADHIFNFTFKKFEYSESFSPFNKVERDDDGKIVSERGEQEIRVDTDLRIQMEPTGSYRYSYIGTRDFIKKFQLIILDFDDEYMTPELDTPHLQMYLSHRDDAPTEPSFGVFLWLEPERVQDITRRILDEKVNGGSFSFSTASRYDGDVVFQSTKGSEWIPKDYFVMNGIEFDETKHRNLLSSYPTKLLPSNFYDYDHSIVKRQKEDARITSFNLTFSKTISSYPEENTRYSPEQQEIIDWYARERMYRNLDEL